MSSELSDIVSKIKGTIALSFSYQAEDIVTLDLLLKTKAQDIEVFALDTLKHFQACKTYHKQVEDFYGINIKTYKPDQNAVDRLEIKLGEYGMRGSLEDRHLCCEIRKVKPLEIALQGRSAWVTGLRAAQSVTRANLQIVECDAKYKLFKIAPIASWSEKEVFDYISTHHLPLNELYSQGFKSIGCEPCTRAVKEGEDVRAGRWWWENPEHKECGLHIK
ncbi:phosphoadenosine phosphosulfate reductase [Campylobacterota bacterium]|nr:phosphoadenosine phosphosulfate reductase [Campylobacterota bacterium]